MPTGCYYTGLRGSNLPECIPFRIQASKIGIYMTKEQLKLRDWYLLVDRSGSMNEPVKSGSSLTRWAEAQEATTALARFAEEFDDDGISVVLFSTNHSLHDNITAGGDLVKKLFTDNQPNGNTNTSGALLSVTDAYFTRKAANAAETKPLVIFIVTDGEPNSKEDLQNAITAIANKVDNVDEIRINFIQVGDNAEAKKYLHHLDSELTCKFDIVNCKTEDEVGSYPSLGDAIMAMVNDMAEATA